MKYQIQLRRDTLANWEFNNPVLKPAEFGIIMDQAPIQFVMGDGVTLFNNLTKYTFSSSGGGSLSSLSDTTISSPQNKQFLKYDTSLATPKWVNSYINLSDLNDATISSPSDGQLLKYNGTKWINSSLPSATSSVLGGIKVASTIPAPPSYEALSTTGKNYQIQLDTNGKAFVNVPSGTNTPAGVDALGGIKVATGCVVAAPSSWEDMSGTAKYYPVLVNSAGLAFVNIPWVSSSGSGAYVCRTATSATPQNGNLLGINAISNTASALSSETSLISWESGKSSWAFNGGIHLVGNGNYGGVVYFGDFSAQSQPLCYIGEMSDDVLTIHGSGGIVLSVGSSGTISGLPNATSSNAGCIKIGYTQNNKNYPVELDVNGKAFVNVPWTGGGPGGAVTSVVGQTGDVTALQIYTALQPADSTSASAIGTSSDLVTERDIYYGLPTINGAHDYTSSTTLFVPTSAGTSGYWLKSGGTGNAPTWESMSNMEAGKDGDGNIITSTYLKLSGGTMTGAIKLASGDTKGLLDGNDHTLLYYSGTTMYLGAEGYPTSSLYLNSFGTNIVHRSYSGPSSYLDYTMWDASNSNKDNVTWACSSLAVGTGGAWVIDVSSSTLRFVYSSSAKATLSNTGSLVTVGDQVLSSDESLKENFKDICYTVADIAKCRAVSFDWKDGRGRSAGSIAQDWESLIPELVQETEYGKALAYGQVSLINTILIARSIVEKDKEIQSLKNRVLLLEAQVENLRS